MRALIDSAQSRRIAQNTERHSARISTTKAECNSIIRNTRRNHDSENTHPNKVQMKSHEISRSSSNKILQKISLSPRGTENGVQMPLVVNQSMLDNVKIAKSYNRENQILFRRSSPKP